MMVKCTMPADENAEKAVIGAMLFDDYGLKNALDCLSSEDFYYIGNQKIFQAIVSISGKGESVDFVTVTAALGSEVSQAYVVELMANTSTSANVKSHCNILLDLAYRRRCIIKADAVLEAAISNDVEKLNTAVENIKTDTAGAAQVESVPSILERALIQIAERRRNGEQLAGYSTGFFKLDQLISGLEKRKLFVVAGRPAMGKTAFALNVCQHIAKRNVDKNTVFFSLEMPKDDVALRLFSSALNISNEHFKFNMLSAEELLKVGEYTESFADETKNFYIEDNMNVSINDILKSCRGIKNKSGKEFALIVIDHLQIVRVADNGNRATDLGEISRTALMIAKEFDCPVMLLSQINRGVEGRQNKRPILADLKESGNIEQDADTVMFIYRDEVYDSSSKDKGNAEIIVAKQRNGALGTIKLGFKKWTTTFYNLG